MCVCVYVCMYVFITHILSLKYLIGDKNECALQCLYVLVLFMVNSSLNKSLCRCITIINSLCILIISIISSP